MTSLNPVYIRVFLKVAIGISFFFSVHYPYKIYSFCDWQSQTGWFKEQKLLFFSIILYWIASAISSLIKKDYIFSLIDFIFLGFYSVYTASYLAISSFFGGQPIEVAFEKGVRGISAYLTGDKCRIQGVEELGYGFYPFWLVGVFMLLLAWQNYKLWTGYKVSSVVPQPQGLEIPQEIQKVGALTSVVESSPSKVDSNSSPSQQTKAALDHPPMPD